MRGNPGPAFRETLQNFAGKPYNPKLGNLTYISWEHRRLGSLQGMRAWPSLTTVSSSGILPVQRQHLTVPPQSEMPARPQAQTAPRRKADQLPDGTFRWTT